MLDITISAVLAILTIVMAYLGVHVTLHPKTESPREQFWYKVGFFGCGLVAVSLVIWQGARNASSQRSATTQIAALQGDVQGARHEAENARSEAQGARHEVENESNRRQQAEKDLLIALQATGNATRKGVAEDIKKNPVKVEVSGSGIQDPEETKRRLEVRNSLGTFLQQAQIVKSYCLIDRPPEGFKCVDQANAWAVGVLTYLGKNLEASYQPRFNAAIGLHLGYNAAKTEEINNAVNYLTFKSAILETFIRELR